MSIKEIQLGIRRIDKIGQQLVTPKYNKWCFKVMVMLLLLSERKIHINLQDTKKIHKLSALSSNLLLNKVVKNSCYTSFEASPSSSSGSFLSVVFGKPLVTLIFSHGLKM